MGTVTRRPPRMGHLLGLLAVGAVLLASCSGGGSPGRSGAAPLKRVAPAHRSAGAPTGTSPSAGPAAGAGAPLCLAIAAANPGPPPSASTPVAASERTAFSKFESAEPRILAAASPAIKGDFQQVFAVYNKFFRALAAVGYDPSRIPKSETQSFSASSAQLTSASKAIQTYVGKLCGTPPPSPAARSPGP